MLIADGQREIRNALMGGFMGQLVSGILWLVSAALANWTEPKIGYWFLFIAGAGIFPLTNLGLKLIGHDATIRHENPLRLLGMQIAFTVPLVMPLAAAAAMHTIAWFYPACLLIVGAHYLPFVFLYGMRTFAVLGAVMMASGLAVGLWAREPANLGGWVGGGVLIVFAFILRGAWKAGTASGEASTPA